MLRLIIVITSTRSKAYLLMPSLKYTSSQLRDSSRVARSATSRALSTWPTAEIPPPASVFALDAGSSAIVSAAAVNARTRVGAIRVGAIVRTSATRAMKDAELEKLWNHRAGPFFVELAKSVVASDAGSSAMVSATATRPG